MHAHVSTGNAGVCTAPTAPRTAARLLEDGAVSPGLLLGEGKNLGGWGPRKPGAGPPGLTGSLGRREAQPSR